MEEEPNIHWTIPDIWVRFVYFKKYLIMKLLFFLLYIVVFVIYFLPIIPAMLGLASKNIVIFLVFFLFLIIFFAMFILEILLELFISTYLQYWEFEVSANKVSVKIRHLISFYDIFFKFRREGLGLQGQFWSGEINAKWEEIKEIKFFDDWKYIEIKTKSGFDSLIGTPIVCTEKNYATIKELFKQAIELKNSEKKAAAV